MQWQLRVLARCLLPRGGAGGALLRSPAHRYTSGVTQRVRRQPAGRWRWAGLAAAGAAVAAAGMRSTPPVVETLVDLRELLLQAISNCPPMFSCYKSSTLSLAPALQMRGPNRRCLGPRPRGRGKWAIWGRKCGSLLTYWYGKDLRSSQQNVQSIQLRKLGSVGSGPPSERRSERCRCEVCTSHWQEGARALA